MKKEVRFNFEKTSSRILICTGPCDTILSLPESGKSTSPYLPGGSRVATAVGVASFCRVNSLMRL